MRYNFCLTSGHYYDGETLPRKFIARNTSSVIIYRNLDRGISHYNHVASYHETVSTIYRTGVLDLGDKSYSHLKCTNIPFDDLVDVLRLPPYQLSDDPYLDFPYGSIIDGSKLSRLTSSVEKTMKGFRIYFKTPSDMMEFQLSQ